MLSGWRGDHAKPIGVAVILFLGIQSGGFAAVKLPPVLGAHMVLQREMRAPIWGTAAPGEKVTVEFAGQKKETTADTQGKWRVELDPMPASAESRNLTVVSDRTPEPVILEDVLVGDGGHRRRTGRCQQPGGEAVGGGALQLAGDGAPEPLQQGGLAGVAVFHGARHH